MMPTASILGVVSPASAPQAQQSPNVNVRSTWLAYLKRVSMFCSAENTSAPQNECRRMTSLQNNRAYYCVQFE